MKRLLLPLLAAIALPNFAGDLGNADFESFKNKYGQFSEKEDRTKNFKNVRCGFFLQHEKCIVNIENGLLRVDNSIGIRSSQIKDYSLSAFKENNFYLTIFYEDKSGIDTFANFHVKGQKNYSIFMREFLYFLNQNNKQIPNNYF